MSSISIAGDTSGTAIIQAPAVAGTPTLTLPTTTGTFALTSDAIVTKYLITSSVDVVLNGNTITGTTGQSGQVNIGSSFTMTIPTNGIITFVGFSGRVTNDGNAINHNGILGIRISTTNYWFGYTSTTAPSYSYGATIITGGNVASTVTDFYGFGNSGSGQFISLDVAGNSIPTGSQTVQLIGAMTGSTAGSTMTLSGTARQTRVILTVTT